MKRILLADDHKLLSSRIRQLLEKDSEFLIIAEAEDGIAAVNLAKELKPDIIVMDISMPKMNGIDATQEICRILPATKIIALSVHTDKRFVSRIFAAGAVGYVMKDCAFEQLKPAIEAIIDDKMFLSPELSLKEAVGI